MATDNSFLTVVNGQTGSNVSFGGQNSAITATGSILLSSANCHLVLPPAASTATAASGEFTIEAWVYPRSIATNASSGAGTAIAVNVSPTVPYPFGWSLELSRSTSSTWALRFYVASTTGVVGTTSYSINAWHHIAVVRDSSNVIRLFVDGVPDSSTLSYSSALNDTSVSPLIGKSGYSLVGGPNFDGYITNFRFVNGRSLYPGTFTPSTAPLQSIFNTAILLTAPQANTGTLYNEPFIQDSSHNNWLVSNASDDGNTTFATFSTSSPFTTTTNQVITNSIVDAVKYASNSIATVGGSAYWPTAYANTKTAQISLNDPMVRALAGVPTGQISFSNFVNDTIYTQTWRSRISQMGGYTVPGLTTRIDGWASDNAALTYALQTISSSATRYDKGNTFGNTSVGLYEPNSPSGGNSIPVVAVAQGDISPYGQCNFYVFTSGNTAASNLHALRIGANSIIVGNQFYPNSVGGFQNFANVTAGNVGGSYNVQYNYTTYTWVGQTYGSNTTFPATTTSIMANISGATPTNTGNVTTFYIT